MNNIHHYLFDTCKFISERGKQLQITYFKLNFYKESASGCHGAYAFWAEWRI